MMTPQVAAVENSASLPRDTEVVIIGGGIIGATAALTLSERGIPVVLLEKGLVGAEQSSRNLGWVRKMGRDPQDVPLSLAADPLWAGMQKRVGVDVGYRRAGIMYIVRTAKEMAQYESWLQAVSHLNLDSRLLSNQEIGELVPGGEEKWYGGIYTPSDGRAEPGLAAPAIANRARELGAIIRQQCAARLLSLSGGKISGVITEAGEIRCRQVLLAGGVWSRKFLARHGVKYFALPTHVSVLRTEAFQDPTEIAVGAPDFSFRKRLDGGFTVTQRGAVEAEITPDHFRIGVRFLKSFFANRRSVRLSLSPHFWQELTAPRHWSKDDISPFEKIRVLDPPVNKNLNNEAWRNLTRAWPIFNKAAIAEEWAGVIDITPDSLPVISEVSRIPGLVMATGFSGHGFGTSPAAGQLAADLLSGHEPTVDPHPYRFERF